MAWVRVQTRHVAFKFTLFCHHMLCMLTAKHKRTGTTCLHLLPTLTVYKEDSPHARGLQEDNQ